MDTIPIMVWFLIIKTYDFVFDKNQLTIDVNNTQRLKAKY